VSLSVGLPADLHLGGPDDPAFQTVTFKDLADHLTIPAVVDFAEGDGLMNGRIEDGIGRPDGLDAEIGQGLQKLTLHHGHPIAEVLDRPLIPGGQSAFEIVHNGQKAEDELLEKTLSETSLVALHALAIVVEICLGTARLVAEGGDEGLKLGHAIDLFRVLLILRDGTLLRKGFFPLLILLGRGRPGLLFRH